MGKSSGIGGKNAPGQRIPAGNQSKAHGSSSKGTGKGRGTSNTSGTARKTSGGSRGK